MEKKIITISREFGSGGRTVGRMVAEKLGIPFYDKELVDQVALESGFAPKFVEEHGEHSPGSSLFSYAFAPQGVPGVMNGLSTADFLWNIQCNVILQLADKGPCVIVGRNADYILKDRQDALYSYSLTFPTGLTGLCACTANRRKRRKRGFRKRISAAGSTTSTTPAEPGACPRTITCAWIPAYWALNSVWTSSQTLL